MKMRIIPKRQLTNYQHTPRHISEERSPHDTLIFPKPLGRDPQFANCNSG